MSGQLLFPHNSEETDIIDDSLFEQSKLASNVEAGFSSLPGVTASALISSEGGQDNAISTSIL